MIFTEDSAILRNHLVHKIKNEKLNELKKLFNFFKTITLNKISIQSYYSSNFKSQQIIESTFVSDTIKHESRQLFKKSCLSVTINSIQFQINVFSSGESLSAFITNLLIYLQFITNITQINIHTVTLNYYLVDQNKVLKEELNGELSKDEVNSGSCQRFDSEAIINIWRKEEILKVTIHELIHAFSFDYINEGDLKNHYNNKYNLEGIHINSQEAYTEIWAQLINCFIISQYTDQDKQYEMFSTMVLLEKEFSDFQSDKIFNHTNLSNEIININKETNVLAYYIIKNELYKSLNVFLQFCRTNNDDYIKIIDIKKYQLFLKKRKRDKGNDKSLKDTTNHFILKTMRMSLNELKVI